MPSPPGRRPKTALVETAERLFAVWGIDGVSLRQIVTAAGMGNNSAVQYHFGTKEHLVRAIFEYRLPNLYARRSRLVEDTVPEDLRGWVECFVLPILEFSEIEGSHYLRFLSGINHRWRRQLLGHLPSEYVLAQRFFRERLQASMGAVPEPIRAHRIAQALTFAIHAGAEREAALGGAETVMPFAVHATDLLDGLVGFLQSPVSAAALAALEAQPGPDGARSALL